MMFGNKIKKINRNKQIFKRKNVHQKYTTYPLVDSCLKLQ